MNYTKILSGINEGDQIGGPFDLASVLIDCVKKNNKFNKEDLSKMYLSWWRNGAFDTGPTYASVFTKIENGMQNDEAVFETHKQFDGNTAGCGPAHRASPLAGFDIIKTDSLIQVAKEEAKITHYHEDAGNGSAIVVMLCRYLLEGKSFDEAKKLVSKNDELKDSWTKVQCAELKPDGYIFNVIHSALYFIQENKSLKDAIKFSGSANYCSVLVGAIKACLSK